MICDYCVYREVIYKGCIGCQIGCEPCYDVDQEQEDCDGFLDREEQRRSYEAFLFDLGKAKAKGEI